MMTSWNGNTFHVTGPLCAEFTGHRWIPLTKASDAELWCFLWSVPWINGWVNNREVGDLRHHRPHYDVIVMLVQVIACRRTGAYLLSPYTSITSPNTWRNIDINRSLRWRHNVYVCNDVIVGMMASEITSLTIVYSTVYAGADQRKHQRSASPGIGEFPAQMASNSENVSIWCRHHDNCLSTQSHKT